MNCPACGGVLKKRVGLPRVGLHRVGVFQCMGCNRQYDYREDTPSNLLRGFKNPYNTWLAYILPRRRVNLYCKKCNGDRPVYRMRRGQYWHIYCSDCGTKLS
jgi:hypothetical protein